MADQDALTDDERDQLRRARTVAYDDGKGGWLFRDGTADELVATVGRIVAARVAQVTADRDNLRAQVRGYAAALRDLGQEPTS